MPRDADVVNLHASGTDHGSRSDSHPCTGRRISNEVMCSLETETNQGPEGEVGRNSATRVRAHVACGGRRAEIFRSQWVLDNAAANAATTAATID